MTEEQEQRIKTGNSKDWADSKTLKLPTYVHRTSGNLCHFLAFSCAPAESYPEPSQSPNHHQRSPSGSHFCIGGRMPPDIPKPFVSRQAQA